MNVHTCNTPQIYNLKAEQKNCPLKRTNTIDSFNLFIVPVSGFLSQTT